MDWNDIGKEALMWVLTVMVPITLGYLATAARVWIRAHTHGLWQKWALEVVTQIEVKAKGQLTGEQKRLMAVEMLKDKGVSADDVNALVEWAVGEQQMVLDTIVEKRLVKEANE